MFRAARAPTAAADNAPPLQRWLTRHALMMLVGAASAAVSAQGAFLALPAVVSFTLLGQHRPSRQAWPRRRAGLANGLTAARVAVVVLAAASMPGLGTAWVMAAFTLNVAVDTIDGYVARRFDAATSFGAVFDREADALFVLVAYLYFFMYEIGDLGAWVLLPGVLPYLYRLGVATLSAPVAPESKEPLAARLAAVNFVLLLVAVALPRHAAPILMLSISIVLLSFGRSFWSLCRHAHSFS